MPIAPLRQPELTRRLRNILIRGRSQGLSDARNIMLRNTQRFCRNAGARGKTANDGTKLIIVKRQQGVDCVSIQFHEKSLLIFRLPPSICRSKNIGELPQLFFYQR
jgi:hypothetical protein